jgi:hypothetical protein
MKKFALIIAVVFGTIVVSNAQDVLKSKQGVPILPEAGDYAIGIDATPIFNFFGNMVKINSGAAFNDPAAWNFVDGTNAIYGKYFKDAETAYRVSLRLGMVSNTDKEYSTQDQATPDPLVTVTDKQKVGQTNIIIGAGLEKHRGKGRMHGIYGAEFQFMMASYKEKYEYGNAISSTYTNPTRTSFDFDNDGISDNNLGGGTWLKEYKAGGTIGVGARAFVGAEFYILPKISVGGEFGWSLFFVKQADGSQTVEYWDGTTIKSPETKKGGAGQSGFDTDNFNGCINMTFHF